ncbi:DUF6397 family protein [Streptomyces sp. NPDC014894]|uniref:DUF6397 family protein n=1 Tax=Streptomyces sp. NPDC014894 TaxID=3364931 RepID=UPI0036F50DB0
MAVQERLTTAGAARLLELKRSEFDLAVQLGHVRAPSRAGGGAPGVARAEIERLRGSRGFPEELRERVRTVGTREGAELLGISPARFTRLARTGHFAPVTVHTNRYHAVVWRYLAVELREFAEDCPDLLSGRTPPALREMLDEGEDRRARAWRGRRLGTLLRVVRDPWERSAAVAALLDPVTVAEVVTDPYERACLRLLRPEPVPPRPLSPPAQEVLDRLRVADRPDEVLRYRVSLALALRQARRACPPPAPAGAETAGAETAGVTPSVTPGTDGTAPERPGAEARSVRRLPMESPGRGTADRAADRRIAVLGERASAGRRVAPAGGGASGGAGASESRAAVDVTAASRDGREARPAVLSEGGALVTARRGRLARGILGLLRPRGRTPSCGPRRRES